MKVESITYDIAAKKWSAPLPTALDSERTLVFVVGPVDLVDEPRALAELVRAFPRSQVVGCGTSGAVADKVVRDDVVHVTITQFEKTTMSVAQYGPSADAFTAGQIIAKKLSKPSLRGILVLADGIEVNGAELVRGLNSALDQSVAVIGGLAGDGTRFERTWVLSGSSIKSGLAVGVGLYGEHVVVAHSSRTGWNKVGEELTVTKSDGRTVYEIDGRPAAKVYEEIRARAGAKSSLGAPLAVRASARHDKSLIRTVVAVDAEKQSIRLAVDLPQGYLVQGVSAGAPELVAAAREAGATTKNAAQPVGQTSFVLAVSHVGRRLQLDAKAGEEIVAAVDALPPGPKAHVTGFYGYGEIAPIGEGHADLHNQSLTLAVIMESPTPIARKVTRGLATGAARAQGAASAAGPAAYLRSRHQTVDDLFKELELEGGKRVGIGRPVGVPPPAPPPRRLTPAPAGNVAVKEEAAISSARPSELRAPEAVTRTRQKTPPYVATNGAAAQKSDNRGTVEIASFAFDPKAGRWSVPTLPELDSEKTLVLAFGVPALGATTAPLDELVRAYPRSHVVGCASSKILRGGSVGEGGVAVTVAKFRSTTIETAWSDLSAGAQVAGDAIGRQLSRPGLRAILLFGDSSADGDALARGLAATVPSSVVIAGGLAADEGNRRWVMAGATVRPGIAVAVGLYGDHLVLGHATRSGFEAFGPERRVTRAAGRVLYELDGRPALTVYTEYLGPRSSPLRPGAIDLPFPLAMRSGNDANAPTAIRMPVAFDQTAQSITFAAELPADAVVRLMRGNQEHLLNEVATAATTASKVLGTLPNDAIILAVSSAGRARTLGARAEEEPEGITLAMPRTTRSHVTGFYAVSELATHGGKPEVLNESIALTILSESAEVMPRQDAPSDRRTIPAPSHPAETPSPPVVLPSSSMPTSSRQPKRRVEITRPVMSGGASAAGGTATAKVTMAKAGDTTVVTITGRLSESFKGDAVGRELSGTIIFDLGGVERITSFGVREWLQMLSTAQDRVTKVYFAQCSEAVVNQLSMIRKFAGSGQVVSFFAPYLCDSCGEQFERLFDCELDAAALRTADVPDSVCQRCSGRGRFDDDPETYLAFTPQHIGQPIPPEIRAALDELAAAAPTAAPDLVDKTIEGETTRVRVQSKAGGAIRWARILDGIEGALVIDLGGVAVIDDAGVASFTQALSTLGDEVASVRIERSPQAVVDSFALSGVPRRVTIASTVLTGFCASCNVQRPALLVADQHAGAIALGREPTLHCKRCNGTLSLVGAGTALQVLAKHRTRNSQAPRASAPPGTISGRPSSSPPSIPTVALPRTQSMAPIPYGASFAPPPGVQPVVAQPPPSGQRGVLIGAGILSLAILLAAGVYHYARSRMPQPVETPTTVANAGGSAWSPAIDLPPPWVERPLVEENGGFLMVGRSEHAPSADVALTQARNEAIIRLLRQMQADLPAPMQEFVAARAKDADVQARSAQIAERYLRQVGTFAQPERADTVVRQRDGGIEAFARYRLSRAAYNQALNVYKQSATFQGLTAVRVFPLLDASPEAELVITAATRGRSGDLAGVKVGDMVIAASGRPLSTTEGFGKLESELAPLAAGNGIELALENGPNKRVVKVKKPHGAYYAPPPLAPQTTTTPKEPARKDPPKDLGIIPPPRPF